MTWPFSMSLQQIGDMTTAQILAICSGTDSHPPRPDKTETKEEFKERMIATIAYAKRIPLEEAQELFPKLFPNFKK